MDIRYYKEQQKNYMVIRQTESEDAIGYHRRMLASRKMEYLIRAGVRIVDGDRYNYYDISSRISLGQLFGTREMDIRDIQALLTGLRSACEEADAYLLDTSRIALDPGLIFYSCLTSRYSFIYNISTSPDEETGDMMRLMDMLLDRVSPRDSEAQDLVYGLYERYERGDFDIWDLIQTYAGYTDRSNSGTDVDMTPDLRADEEPDTSFIQEHTVAQDQGVEIIPPAMKTGASDVRGLRPAWLYLSPLAVGAAGAVACAIIFFTMRLNPDEELLLYAAAGVSVAVMTVGIFLVIRARLGSRAETGDDETPVTYSKPLPQVHMHDFVEKSVHPSGNKPAGISSAMARSADMPEGADGSTEDGAGASTVFFEEGLVPGRYKLYALDRKNKKHIELDKLPCTIGKMNGYVDCLLDHPSISRIHARLEMDGDHLVLSDLNSTNGVWLNGIRLMPNEKREIEEGDEIRLGALNYCLRSCG